MALLLHLGLVLLPGFLLATLTGVRHQQLLFSTMFSFAVLVSGVSLARNHHFDTNALLWGYGILFGVLVALLLGPGRRLLRLQRDAIRAAWSDRAWRTGLGVVAGVYIAWYGWTGPYTEVPADLYRHLEFTRLYLEYIQQGSLGPPLGLWQIVTQHGGFWYVLVALVAHLSDSKLDALLAPLMGVNGLLFLLGVYLFSHRLLKPFDLAPPRRAAAATLSAVFVATQMGVTVFAFIRYYSMAPVVLNILVFFAAQVCLLDLLDGRRINRLPGRLPNHAVSHGLLWFLCLLVALVMHNQEGLFVLLTALALLLWLALDALLWPRGDFSMARLAAVIAGALIVLVASTAVLVTVFHSAPDPADALGKVVGLPLRVPGYGDLYILNPGYQFFQVITVWGGLVAVLFLLRIQRYRAQPWLPAVMLLPFITVFNPVFVDLYLRIEGGHSLWRICFLVPLYQVAALWMVDAWGYRRAVLLPWRFAGWGAAALLILLVLPLPGMEKINPGVRTTLLPVERENSWRQWGDLVDVLNDIPGSENVLTDPVTGYVVSALTPHKTFRYKFFPSALYRAFPFVFESYGGHPLSRYRGWLLLVNLRDGASSHTGRHSGHWPVDVMRVSGYYPDSLRRYLADHGDRFERLWSGADITVYRVLQ